MKNVLKNGLVLIIASLCVSSVFAACVTIDSPVYPPVKHHQAQWCKKHPMPCEQIRQHNEQYCNKYPETKFCKAHHIKTK